LALVVVTMETRPPLLLVPVLVLVLVLEPELDEPEPVLELEAIDSLHRSSAEPSIKRDLMQGVSAYNDSQSDALIRR
jgi:hypothetical protein